MKHFERKNPCLSFCGLNCLLCPMQLSGHCGGCGFGSQSCPIAWCSLEHGKPEYCSECEEYPCGKYDHIDEWDSFVTHQKQKANLKKCQRMGPERYNEEQVKRREILDRLLAEYNDGRRKTLFCLAANLLEMEKLNSLLEEAEEQMHSFSLKERADSEGNPLWYPLMMQYLAASPYGKKYGCSTFEDLLSCLKRRQELELRLIREILKDRAVVLPAKKYTMEDLEWIKIMLRSHSL